MSTEGEINMGLPSNLVRSMDKAASTDDFNLKKKQWTEEAVKDTISLRYNFLQTNTSSDKKG